MVDILKLLSQYKKSAPVNVEGLIREIGIQLDSKADLDQKISGEIALLDSGIYKISANKNEHYYRRRFTMAHELGHYLMHKDLIGNGVDDSKKYRSTEDGSFYNTAIEKIHERQANEFAVNLLVPIDLLTEEAKKNSDIEHLSRLFQVSKASMQIRLQSL